MTTTLLVIALDEVNHNGYKIEKFEFIGFRDIYNTIRK